MSFHEEVEERTICLPFFWFPNLKNSGGELVAYPKNHANLFGFMLLDLYILWCHICLNCHFSLRWLLENDQVLKRIIILTKSKINSDWRCIQCMNCIPNLDYNCTWSLGFSRNLSHILQNFINAVIIMCKQHGCKFGIYVWLNGTKWSIYTEYFYGGCGIWKCLCRGGQHKISNGIF